MEGLAQSLIYCATGIETKTNTALEWCRTIERFRVW